MRMRPTAGLRLLAGLSAMVALAGCGGRQDVAQTTPSLRALLVDFGGTLVPHSMESEEAIAACMHGEGFEYIPYVRSRPPVQDFENAGFRETYGYGVTTIEESVLPEDNPNFNYETSLSERAREAYILAMFGPPGQDPLNPTAGCFNQAQTNIRRASEFMAEHGSALTELGVSISSDPRVAAATVNWSDCMAAEGFSFAAQVEIPKWLSNQRGSITSLQATELELAEIDFRCWEQHLKQAVDTAYAEQTLRILETDQNLLDDLQVLLRDAASDE